MEDLFTGRQGDGCILRKGRIVHSGAGGGSMFIHGAKVDGDLFTGLGDGAFIHCGSFRRYNLGDSIPDFYGNNKSEIPFGRVPTGQI